jgi:hypothetical protein
VTWYSSHVHLGAVSVMLVVAIGCRRSSCIHSLIVTIFLNKKKKTCLGLEMQMPFQCSGSDWSKTGSSSLNGRLLVKNGAGGVIGRFSLGVNGRF